MNKLTDLALSARIPERFARMAVVAVLSLLLAALLAVAKCSYDRSIIGHHDSVQEVETVKRLSPANDKAADDRARETITLSTKQQELHDAIHSVPDAPPAAPSVRLGCERLRRQGTDLSRIPACGGRAGGDRAQADGAR